MEKIFHMNKAAAKPCKYGFVVSFLMVQAVSALEQGAMARVLLKIMGKVPQNAEGLQTLSISQCHKKPMGIAAREGGQQRNQGGVFH
jgi:hypothetical protein